MLQVEAIRRLKTLRRWSAVGWVVQGGMKSISTALGD
jgi:hypothetical protein